MACGERGVIGPIALSHVAVESGPTREPKKFQRHMEVKIALEVLLLMKTATFKIAQVKGV